MDRARIVGVIAAATALLSPLVGGIDIRFSQTSVAAALSPLAPFLWISAAITIALSWQMTPPDAAARPAKWAPILLALFVDSWVYFTVLFVPLCFVALFLEAGEIGEFAWQFSRSVSRPTDAALIALFFFSFAFFWATLGILLRSGRGSPGSLATGIILKADVRPPVWRCALFGIFSYASLAFPFLKPLFGWGAFSASAWTRAT